MHGLSALQVIESISKELDNKSNKIMAFNTLMSQLDDSTEKYEEITLAY